MEPLRIRLVVASGPNEGDVVPVHGAEFVIGRQPGCHFRPRGAGVADRHCAVVNCSGRFYLRNLNPSGTTLAGRQVGDKMELNEGDIFQVGEWHLRVSISEKAPARSTGPDKAHPSRERSPGRRKIVVGPKERAMVLLRQREWEAMQARKKPAVPVPPALPARKRWVPVAGVVAVAGLLAGAFFLVRGPSTGVSTSALPLAAVHEAGPRLVPAGSRPPRRRAAAPPGVAAELPGTPSVDGVPR